MTMVDRRQYKLWIEFRNIMNNIEDIEHPLGELIDENENLKSENEKLKANQRIDEIENLKSENERLRANQRMNNSIPRRIDNLKIQFITLKQINEQLKADQNILEQKYNSLKLEYDLLLKEHNKSQRRMAGETLEEYNIRRRKPHILQQLEKNMAKWHNPPTSSNN